MEVSRKSKDTNFKFWFQNIHFLSRFSPDQWAAKENDEPASSYEAPTSTTLLYNNEEDNLAKITKVAHKGNPITKSGFLAQRFVVRKACNQWNVRIKQERMKKDLKWRTLSLFEIFLFENLNLKDWRCYLLIQFVFVSYD